MPLGQLPHQGERDPLFPGELRVPPDALMAAESFRSPCSAISRRMEASSSWRVSYQLLRVVEPRCAPVLGAPLCAPSPPFHVLFMTEMCWVMMAQGAPGAAAAPLSPVSPRSTTSRSTPLKTMQTMCTTSCGRPCTLRSSPVWTGWGDWICGT
ncbi:hypothetical protein GDO81_026682 [Engystomops pustulosus]|uniref:Uncharacterized protein n=1 Tax=Engystomops pustulosus TaxID=76066 RepID=A0AAV6ZGB8_ENGPU|nr:hypothetical protein GDO81_026682 [Engystomops pustulosus]